MSSKRNSQYVVAALIVAGGLVFLLRDRLFSASQDKKKPGAASAQVASTSNTTSPTVSVASAEKSATPINPPKENLDQMSCAQLIKRIHENLQPNAPEPTDEGITRMIHMARRAADLDAKKEEYCSEKVFKELASSPSCGDLFHAAAAGLFASEQVISDRIASLLDTAKEDCQTRILRAAQHTTNVDLKLVKLTEKLAKTTPASKGELKMASWLTLGSLQYIARNTKKKEVIDYVDPIIFEELKSSEAERARLFAIEQGLKNVDEATKKKAHEDTEAAAHQRLVTVEAAGNGACEKCFSLLENNLKDKEWDVRRSSASAFRFHQSKTALDHMCRMLLEDERADVREQAGWALRFTENFETDRIGCLLAAAERDPSLEVRRVAMQSITALGATFSSSALDAFSHLLKERFPEEVRKSAYAHLLSMAKTNDPILGSPSPFASSTGDDGENPPPEAPIDEMPNAPQLQ